VLLARVKQSKRTVSLVVFFIGILGHTFGNISKGQAVKKDRFFGSVLSKFWDILSVLLARVKQAKRRFHWYFVIGILGYTVDAISKGQAVKKDCERTQEISHRGGRLKSRIDRFQWCIL